MKCIEQIMPLYFAFIDLTQAFDTVNTESLWTVLECIGCPPKFVTMIRLFHDGMTGQFLSSDNVTETFKIINDVKQGFFLSPGPIQRFLRLHAVSRTGSERLYSLPFERLPFRPSSPHSLKKIDAKISKASLALGKILQQSAQSTKYSAGYKAKSVQ